MTYNYHLSLGSNIEPKLEYLQSAVSFLQRIGRVKQKSGLYRTDPWGIQNQPVFYNAVIEVESDLDPHRFIEAVKEIEKRVGRKKSFHWGPREIDIDIIFSNVNIEDNSLQIPHRAFASRRFVLEPMAEIDISYRITPGGKTIAAYLRECNDKSNVKKLDVSW